MTSEELYQLMEEYWNKFQENHVRFRDKKVKAAGSRARRAILDIKKLVGKYRSTSLNESKEI